jgi:hypothetical protein
MQPWMVCALGAWGLAARRHEMQIDVENDRRAMYAWRFGLAPLLGLQLLEPIQEHEEAGRFIPLKVVRGTSDLGALIADVAPLLHLSAEPEQAKAVQYVVSEMVRNVLEHSASPEGAVVAAQYYRGARANRPYVSIGVADCGLGVYRTLIRNYPNLETDSDAVLTALQPGTTGATGGVYGASDNAGAGLFFTRSLSAATGGYFALASGDAMFRSTLARQSRLDPVLVFPIFRYPGTIVSVEIGLEKPVDMNDFLSDMRESFLLTADQSARRAGGQVRFT